MSHALAARLQSVKPSMILGLVRKARELAAKGAPVIDLGIGEPDFPTPDHVKAAAIEAIRRDVTRYTVVPGDLALRRAIVRKLDNDNGLSYTIDEISVSGGAKQAIFNAMMATVSPGDEIIVPAPYWSSYPDIATVCDGVAIIVDCPQDDRFLLQPAALEAALGPKSRWLMLNSPGNPTGSVYRPDDLRALAEVLERYPDVLVLSDDIYEHLMFDGTAFTSILNVAPQLRGRTVLVNGVSKAFAMTGWRLGYCAGPAHLIAAINAVQSQSTTHACSISQAAATAALAGPQNLVRERAAAFGRRRDRVVAALSDCEGLSVIAPQGAFYVYPDCSAIIGRRTPQGQRIASDIGFCSWLLESHAVSVVPGAAFGLSPHFRLSIAASTDDLDTACQRMRRACAQLKD